MSNGDSVREFEQALAGYCGARYAIATSNGTVSLEATLVALGLKPGDRVLTTPLTMAATTIAILNAGGTPVYRDVRPDTWLMDSVGDGDADWLMPVSLFGLHFPLGAGRTVDDAAQTLRRHDSGAAFTSLSFQASKVLALGEGGALLTNDEGLAKLARSYLSLGYRMEAGQARIDSRVIRDPNFERHHLGHSINGRMNDLTAARGLVYLAEADEFLADRAAAAALYRSAVAGCPWITPQRVPDGWTHDYWSYAVALASADLWHPFADAIERHGGERPYAAWKLTYQEPAFRHLNPRCAGTFADRAEPGLNVGDLRTADGSLCPIAESLQPRIVAFQTNDLASAERNAEAVVKAIRDIGGGPS